MHSSNINQNVSRRVALAGLGAGGLGLAVAARGHSAAAQDAATGLASHPAVGSWMVTNTPPNIGVISADGTMINVGVSSAVGPDQALGFDSPGAGTWEALDDRSVHVTFVQFHTDANGAFTGTVTVDGYPVVAEDGQSWLDDGSQTKVTIRDAATNVIMEIGGDGSLPAVTAYRMGPGNPGFPESTPAGATPSP